VQKRILYVSHSCGWGGAEKLLLLMIRHLDRKKYMPLVLLPNNIGPLYEKLGKEGVREYHFPLPSWVRLKGPYSYRDRIWSYFFRVITVIKIFRLIRKKKIGLVHTNTIVKWSGAIAAKLAGIPHVWHVHENIANSPSFVPFYNWKVTTKLIIYLSDRVIAVSSSVSKGFLEYYRHITKSKIKVINNFVEFSEASSQGIDLRKKLMMGSKEALLIYVGAVVPAKGIIDLIYSAKLLSSQNIKYRMVLAGAVKNGFKAKLTELVELNKLSAQIAIIGFQENVKELLHQSDILVLPSLSEAFPFCILEAMACGLPVVATECGGPSDLVVDGTTGFLVPVGNHKKLADALKLLIVDRKLAKKMGRHGRERHHTLFSKEKTMNQIEEMYDQLLG